MSHCVISGKDEAAALEKLNEQEVLQATHIWETHVHTTVPLLGRERPWILSSNLNSWSVIN